MNNLLNEVREDLPDHHYRTELPNIIGKLGLSPYELSVYFHLKQIAGDNGKCWKTNKHLSESCGMSERQTQYALKRLSENFDLLGSPLIKIIERKKPDGSRDSNLIYVINIWRVNGDFFRKMKSCEGGGGGAHCAGGVVQDMHQGGAQCAPKEEQRKKNPIYKKTMSKSAVENVDKPQKKTLPLDKSKKRDDVSIQKRWGLTPDQLSTYEWLKAFGDLSSVETMVYWAKTYSIDRLQSVHRQAVTKKADNVGGYMNKLLKTDAIVVNENIFENKAFAENFVEENRWRGCKIQTKHFVYKMGNHEKEIPLFIPILDFMKEIARAYNQSQ